MTNLCFGLGPLDSMNNYLVETRVSSACSPSKSTLVITPLKTATQNLLERKPKPR